LKNGAERGLPETRRPRLLHQVESRVGGLSLRGHAAVGFANVGQKAPGQFAFARAEQVGEQTRRRRLEFGQQTASRPDVAPTE